MLKAAPLYFLVACAPVSQESVRTVAAIEVVLRTPADRADLLSVIRYQAATDPALHVDDVSDRWEELKAKSKNFPVQADGTFYVGVWRGKDDDEREAGASDMGHKGKVWVTFPKGQNPERSSTFRTQFIAAIRKRFPNSKEIPVLTSGSLPLETDLRDTPTGYKVAKSAASRYDLPPNSEFVAR